MTISQQTGAGRASRTLERVYDSTNIYFSWARFFATSTRINLVIKVNRKVFDNIRYNI